MIDIDLNQVEVPLRWLELFGREGPTDVEIGCGKGRFLLATASARPERDFLAVERAHKYHKLCCERIAKRGLTNVRALHTTAEDLLYRLLPPSSVATLYVLFPDPWPKKRHHKRRLLTPEAVGAMATALCPGGRLLVKSDHPEYAALIGHVLAASEGLRPIDTAPAFAGLPLTGFEVKYIDQGREIFVFASERVVPSTKPT